jgi:AcrR family transcriptional regulator
MYYFTGARDVVVRKGEDRKQTIIDTAERMFYEKGYENTSIQDILDALKFSKGGFYHHFESKLALLQEICGQRTGDAYQRCVEAVNGCQGGAVDKLNALLRTSSFFSQDNMDFIGLLVRVAYRDGSVMLRDNIKRTTIERLMPLMNDIVLEGCREKLFYTMHPDHVGRLILLLGTNLTDEVAELLSKREVKSEEFIKALELLDAYRSSVEMTLNAPYGSIVIVEMERIMSVFDSIIQQERRIAWASFHKKTP